MVRRHLSPLLISCCLLILSLGRVTPSAADAPDGRPSQVVLDLSQISATPSLTEIGYRSPITQAQPFTHMLLRWEADLPAQSAILIEVRASVDGSSWSAWGAVSEEDGGAQPSDDPNVHWSTTLYAGEGARFWQVQASFTPAADGSMPALQRVEVNSVDARYGPPSPTPSPALDAVGKPAVVSRSAWGNPDGQGSQAPPDYYPVNHLVIHHTADANSLVGSETSWADRVRAEWSFHTYSRGWGDIGYNYLIDPNGVIYEGRAGGDNAVGFHDTANYGSMGLSLLGTYSSVAPTQAAQNSLIEILAWKADQQQIDPEGSSYYYGCAYSSYCAPFNSGAVVANIAGHRQVTPGHTTCPGNSLQNLLPSIRQGVQTRMSGAPVQSLELLNVQYDRTTLAAGELLKVTFSVRNSGNTLIETQAPQAGGFNLDDSYVYDEDECFLGAAGQSYPTYPKEANRFRVTLGVVESTRMPTCNGDSGGYPWRWGLNGSLAPGETRQVVGYLRFRDPGSLTLRAGAIKEYVSYVSRDGFAQTITVTAERGVPAPVSYDSQLQTLAQVYRLGNLPDNLLARTQDATSLVSADLVGSFAWNGTTTDWGAGGPLPGLSDNFIIVQSRVFIAPTAGIYTFQTTSDDGSWLWVDATPVVVNAGLHAIGSASGSISLAAGRHVLGFKYFERGGAALAGYSVKLPGASDFTGLIDGLAGAGSGSDLNLGGSFKRLNGITVAADDQGGSGVARLRVSFDGVQWTDVPGQSFSLGSLADGSYTLRYRAVDSAGNESPTQMLSFRVDSTLQVWQTYMPLVMREQ